MPTPYLRKKRSNFAALYFKEIHIQTSIIIIRTPIHCEKLSDKTLQNAFTSLYRIKNRIVMKQTHRITCCPVAREAVTQKRVRLHGGSENTEPVVSSADVHSNVLTPFRFYM